MRKIKTIGLFIFSALIGGCTSQSESPSPQAFMDKPIPVKTASATQRDIPVFMEAIGNVQAYNSVRIKPKVGGELIEVNIKGGERLKIGDVLFRIDPVPYQIALDKAKAALAKDEASLEFARQKLQRYEQLVKRDYVSRLTVDEFRSNVKSLESQVQADRTEVDLARLNLDYTTIVSPINGYASLTRVDRGNIVRPEDPEPLTTILQIQPIFVQFALPQVEFQSIQSLLQRGERTFKVLLPEVQREFDGEVTAVDNQVNLQTGTIQIKGTVPNEQAILWPGEFVRVKLFIRLIPNAILVPFEAIQVGQKGSYVYVLKPDQTVEPVFVKTGEQIEDLIVVEEGLEPGVEVVTDGQINLRSGAKVVVTNRSPPPQTQQEQAS